MEEALEFFGRVNADELATQLQYDYFTAYLDFYKAEPQAAGKIAAKYADYPVERWREAFANIVNQADEINRQAAKVADKEDRTQIQASQAAATPSFEFTVEARQVKIHYQNLKQVQVNYYQMDIELLFSRNPFVQGESKQFSNILPNQTQTVELPAKATQFEFPLPPKLLNSNVLVEIVGAGQTQSQAYYSNALQVKVIENYGQLHVTHEQDAKPLAKVYVKVYARMNDGSVRFYKDGYTDLRGYFDYTSLNTNELDAVQRFSILILSETHGAGPRSRASQTLEKHRGPPSKFAVRHCTRRQTSTNLIQSVRHPSQRFGLGGTIFMCRLYRFALAKSATSWPLRLCRKSCMARGGENHDVLVVSERRHRCVNRQAGKLYLRHVELLSASGRNIRLAFIRHAACAASS